MNPELYSNITPERYKEIKKKFEKIYQELGWSEEKLARMSRLFPPPNCLPRKGVFSKCEFFEDKHNPRMSHVRIYTECGDSITLSALLRKCLFGKEKLANPQFESSNKKYLNGNAELAGTECISPELKKWVDDNGFTSQRQVAKALVGKSFTATPVEVANYYPDREKDRIKKEEIEDMNKNNVNVRIALLKEETLYRVVLD